MLEIAREHTASHSSSIELISLKGSLDVESARDFDRFFQEFVHAGFHFFILDMSFLQRISSEGLASLVRLKKNIEKRRGFFALLHLHSEIKMIFSFLSLDRRIPIFARIEDALEFLSARKQGNKEFVRVGREGQENIPEVEAEAAYISYSSFGKIEAEREQSLILVACSHCGLELNAKKSGAYMCPACGEQFRVDL